MITGKIKAKPQVAYNKCLLATFSKALSILIEVIM